MARADVEGEFTAYVAAQLPGLRRTAFLLCQDWHRADDLTQTAITRLYVHWRRASNAVNMDAYLRAILLNVFLGEQRTAWWKRTRPHAEPEQEAALPEPGAPPDVEALLDLRAALEELAPRRRAAVVLRYYCDLSVEETARTLGCSEGTVKSQTSKGLAQLREALDPFPSGVIVAGAEAGPGTETGPMTQVSSRTQVNSTTRVSPAAKISPTTQISPSTPGGTR